MLDLAEMEQLQGVNCQGNERGVGNLSSSFHIPGSVQHRLKILHVVDSSLQHTVSNRARGSLEEFGGWLYDDLETHGSWQALKDALTVVARTPVPRRISGVSLTEQTERLTRFVLRFAHREKSGRKSYFH
jgi:hypothetical protein